MPPNTLVYVVTLLNHEDKDTCATICYGEEELSDLLQHYDRERFAVVHIEALEQPTVLNWRELLHKDSNLEFGGES